MKTKEEVVSLEPSKELKDLGIEQNSLFYWWRSDVDGWKLLYDPGTIYRNKGYSAFTVAELGELLPDQVDFTQKHYNTNDKRTWYRCYTKEGMMWVDEDTEADARAKMLLPLIKKKIIKVGELGKWKRK